MRSAWLLVSSACLVTMGCSGSDGGSPIGLVDAGADGALSDARAPIDAPEETGFDAHDAPIDTGRDAYFPPLTAAQRMPGLDYLGGALLTSVKVVTVTFSSDDSTLVAHLQTFGDTITTTSWWTSSTSEYCAEPAGTPCIGNGSGGGHVVLTETAPSSLLDTQDGTSSTVEQFIQSHVTSGAFPPPDAQTIYVIYFPSGTTIKLGTSTSCSDFGAYHKSMALNLADGGVVETAYAIEPRCSDENYTTFAASHELIEAATDAHPTKDRGYVMQEFGGIYFGDEGGDICDFPDFLNETAGGFNVQRGWSNKSGRAGHDPCVDEPAAEVYFNTALGAGYEDVFLAVGESVTIPLEPYAEGPSSDWSVSTEETTSRLFGDGASLSFGFDNTTLNVGKGANLTVTLTSKPKNGIAAYVIHSQSGQGHHTWGGSVRLK